MRFALASVSGGLALAASLLIGMPQPVTAQDVTVEGRVTDAATGAPLAGARVLLQGTNISVTTNEEGRYTLSNVSPGTVRVRAIMIGYGSQAQELTVSGPSTTVDFELEAAVVSLDEITVTATGERRRREVANNVATIRADEAIDRGAITGLSDLIKSRASGVQVTNSSGTTGSATRIRVRGSSSLSLTNEPIIYVDGVRIDRTQDALSLDLGGQMTSRLSDLNPEEIESIEIIKGPSATTLYGTEAGNGVVLIETKRGSQGPTQFRVWMEAGIVQDPTDYPTNYHATSADGETCLNFQAAAGLCTQTGLESFNPLEDSETTPVALGNRQQFGLQVSGGNETTQYFVSGEFERELGTMRLPDSTVSRLGSEVGDVEDSRVRPNQLDRVSLRANLNTQLADNINARFSTAYVTSDQRFPQNDNNSLGILPSAFLGGATTEGGWGFFTPDQVFAIRTDSEIERFIGSLQMNYDPLPWLATRGTFGVDVSNQFDDNFFPPGEVPSGTLIDGTRNSNRIKRVQYTADVGATATAELTNDVLSKTSIGGQFFQNISEGTFAFGNRIPEGVESLSGAVITNAFEATAENVTVGVFGEQTFSFRDRLFLTGGVRVDDNNAFGEQFDAVVYPKVSGSWVVSEEPFFPTNDILSGMRLRAAWGQTGVQPTDTAAIRFFNAVAVTEGGEDIPGVTIGSFGNVDLKPERSSEIEFGFDSQLFSGRVGLNLTYFQINTEDALVSRVLAPSLGSSAGQFVNLAEVRNRGFEATLNGQLLNMDNATWDVAITGNTNDNEVLTLGEGIEPIIFGLGGNAQRHQQGYPAGAYFQRPILDFGDENGDGLISQDEVIVGDTAAFLGTPFPKRELSIQTSFTLFNRVRLAGLLDHRGGHKLQNGTAFFRCAQFFNCESSNVPGVDLEQQAALAAYLKTNSRAGFVEDADFWKLREASVTFFFPQQWANAVGGDRISLTLTGRNLFTWTDYRGVDPEVITNAGSNFSTAEFLTQPPVRYWLARINIGF